MINTIEDMLSTYWDAAYSEGKDGRTHDTKSGDAQTALNSIKEAFAELEKERDDLLSLSAMCDLKKSLAIRDLEQQAKGLEDFYPDTNILKDRKSIQLALKDAFYKLRNQAKAIKVSK